MLASNDRSRATTLRSAALRTLALCSVFSLAALSVHAGAGLGVSGLVGSGLGGVQRIFIDAGHGGSDSGAIGNGIIEKQINLQVALRLGELLEADTLDTFGGGTWEVMMSRTDDASVSLSQRSSAANNWPADRFVSIHHNGFSSSLANGTETFSFAAGTPGANLRDFIQDELVLALGLTDRGSKVANFHVLRETNMPAALSEAGFLSNPGDAAVLSAPGAVELLARAHLFGIQRHYGLSPYVPTDGPTVYCMPKITSLGCVPAIGASGTPSLTSSDFVVFCDQVNSQQFGLMFWGRADLSLPLLGGTLCVAGTLTRTPAEFSNGLGYGNCSGRLALSMDNAFMAASGFSPGEDIFCQWWFRDPGLLPALPIGLSDGVRFTVLP